MSFWIVELLVRNSSEIDANSNKKKPEQQAIQLWDALALVAKPNDGINCSIINLKKLRRW